MRWNNIFKRQRIIALGILVLIAGMAVLLYSIAAQPEKQRHVMVWNAAENDVEVKILVVEYSSGQLKLSGTFTPTRRKFYLYGKDLPRDGLNGLGRPTLLEVVKSDSIKVTGPLEADQPVRNVYVEVLDLSFPVYPVGPVTLSLPFELVSNDTLVSLEIAVTYMACSEKTCLPPVIDKQILIQVPASFFTD